MKNMNLLFAALAAFAPGSAFDGLPMPAERDWRERQTPAERERALAEAQARRDRRNAKRARAAG